MQQQSDAEHTSGAGSGVRGAGAVGRGQGRQGQRRRGARNSVLQVLCPLRCQAGKEGSEGGGSTEKGFRCAGAAPRAGAVRGEPRGARTSRSDSLGAGRRRLGGLGGRLLLGGCTGRAGGTQTHGGEPPQCSSHTAGAPPMLACSLPRRHPAGGRAPSVYSQVPMRAMAVPTWVCVVSLLPKNSTAGVGRAEEGHRVGEGQGSGRVAGTQTRRRGAPGLRRRHPLHAGSPAKATSQPTDVSERWCHTRRAGGQSHGGE